jgi:hypothetical protein
MQIFLLHTFTMYTYYFQCERGKRGVLTMLKAINQGQAIEKIYLRYPTWKITLITKGHFYETIERCLSDPKTMACPRFHQLRASGLLGGVQRPRQRKRKEESQGGDDQTRQGSLAL